QVIQCVRKVPYTVCRQVCEPKTICCPVTVSRQVVEPKTICVPRTVCKQVPVEVCCKVPVMVYCDPVVMPSAQSGLAARQSIPFSALPPSDPGDKLFPLVTPQSQVVH